MTHLFGTTRYHLFTPTVTITIQTQTQITRGGEWMVEAVEALCRVIIAINHNLTGKHGNQIMDPDMGVLLSIFSSSRMMRNQKFWRTADGKGPILVKLFHRPGISVQICESRKRQMN
jgi:hypothetical protein